MICFRFVLRVCFVRRVVEVFFYIFGIVIGKNSGLAEYTALFFFSYDNGEKVKLSISTFDGYFLTDTPI